MTFEVITNFEELGEVPEHKRREIEAEVFECLFKAAQHYNVPMPTPEIRYDLTGHVAGRANRLGQYIRLNKTLLLSEHYDEMLNRTVPHEVAHIVQRRLWPNSKSHGSEWAQVMALFGLPPNRTHTYNTTPARKRTRPYSYHCDCREHKVTITLHRRIQNGARYTCRHCKGFLDDGK